MDDAEITAYFIQHLSECDNPGDLVMEICEKTGRGWNEVEALLERVRAEYEPEIVRRQSPLLTVIALATFAVGIGIAIYSTYFLALTFQGYLRHPASPLEIPNMFQTISATVSLAITGLVSGVAMVLGSLLGMKKVWAALLNF